VVLERCCYLAQMEIVDVGGSNIIPHSSEVSESIKSDELCKVRQVC